jgi:hypothetical protein
MSVRKHFLEEQKRLKLMDLLCFPIQLKTSSPMRFETKNTNKKVRLWQRMNLPKEMNQ